MAQVLSRSMSKEQFKAILIQVSSSMPHTPSQSILSMSATQHQSLLKPLNSMTSPGLKDGLSMFKNKFLCHPTLTVSISQAHTIMEPVAKRLSHLMQAHHPS